MARSIHLTRAQAYRGRSRSELDAMFDPAAIDPDVLELLLKRRYKRERLARRASGAAAADPHFDPQR